MPQQSTLFPFARDVVDIAVVDEMSESFLAVLAVGHHVARHPRRARRPQARATARPLRHAATWGYDPTVRACKCAQVVGDTWATITLTATWPIYETLVRMAQPFARNVTLVDPQGNFGSLDDPPAAYRYTECRLTEAAIEMVSELDEETVEFRPTYDGETTRAASTCRRCCPTCWSTAPPASRSAWPPTCPRTTCAKCTTPSSWC